MLKGDFECIEHLLTRRQPRTVHSIRLYITLPALTSLVDTVRVCMARVTAPSFQASGTAGVWLYYSLLTLAHSVTHSTLQEAPNSCVYCCCVQDVTSFLKVNTSALKEDRALFHQSLAAFITANEDPTTSPNFKSKVTDLPGPLLQLLEQASPHSDQDLVLLLLKVYQSCS